MAGAKVLSKKRHWKVSGYPGPSNGPPQFGAKACLRGNRMEKYSTALPSIAKSVSERSTRNRQSVTGTFTSARDAKTCFSRRFAKGWRREEAAQYCGFWIRFCARLLDGLFLSAVTVPLSVINQVIIFRFYPLTGPEAGIGKFENTSQLGTFLTIQAAFVLVSLILAFAYEVFFVGRFGGTPGKLLLRMRIVRSDFSRLTYGRAAIRFFGKMLSDLTMYIGYLMVAFDPQRRALHDYIADTRVIKRDQPAVPFQNEK